MVEKRHFWGDALEVVGTAWSLPAACVGGTISAANGKGFQNGAEAVVDAVAGTLSKFGHQHGEQINGMLFSIAGSIIGDGIKRELP